MLRQSDSCYKFNNQSSITAGAPASTPSPALYPVKEARKRNLVSTPIVNHAMSTEALAVVRSTSSVDSQAMDVTSFINGNYIGHVIKFSYHIIQYTFFSFFIIHLIWIYVVQGRAQLLEAIRVHQERCASHVHSYTEGLKAAIEKENSNFALRILDHVTGGKNITRTYNTPIPLDARRLRYSISPESSERSSAGEASYLLYSQVFINTNCTFFWLLDAFADSRHPKIQRLSSSLLLDGSNSSPEETPGRPYRLDPRQRSM